MKTDQLGRHIESEIEPALPDPSTVGSRVRFRLMNCTQDEARHAVHLLTVERLIHNPTLDQIQEGWILACRSASMIDVLRRALVANGLKVEYAGEGDFIQRQ